MLENDGDATAQKQRGDESEALGWLFRTDQLQPRGFGPRNAGVGAKKYWQQLWVSGVSWPIDGGLSLADKFVKRFCTVAERVALAVYIGAEPAAR